MTKPRSGDFLSTPRCSPSVESKARG
jgi:hypothetical protein